MNRRFLLGALLLAASIPAAAQTTRDAPMLQPGDEVRIRVWRDSEMSGEIGIAPDGTLIHPVYRTLRVTGLPLADVEARIRTFLQRYQTEPQFVAEPLFRVTVGGEVEKPSLYFLPPDVTVRQVVAIAGGATERGRSDRVRLLSGGRQRTISLKGDDPEGNLPIRSGDQFIVESRGSVFRDILAPLIAIAGSAAAIINVSRPRR
ncbi:MAG TPA: polysaccharide biosynthesis/export family protein [Gemmatimonadales bacterium]|nr:polysaccharide biosynthesis/export family protein [Gemmatimonadales bacterium]